MSWKYNSKGHSLAAKGISSASKDLERAKYFSERVMTPEGVDRTRQLKTALDNLGQQKRALLNENVALETARDEAELMNHVNAYNDLSFRIQKNEDRLKMIEEIEQRNLNNM